MNGLSARFGVLLCNVVARENDGKRSQSRHGRGNSTTQAPPPQPPPPPPSDIRRCHEEEEVDYACTAEIVRRHFQSCGIVNRVTILMNEFSLPKGCAYVEFLKIDAVPKALLLNESELHGRKIKVCAKRTNIPGMNQYFGRYTWVLRSRRPPPLYPRPGYGSVPRCRRSMRYRPY
ncbi:unnamed protein product [Trifolium pratense]|uniref:Uncharacterized protein n=1 Tax=Trifolium pratense TaxID=57577 RepID=A0ACB0LV20_TRIPR|nr:unnamed protein product [Trifolium pratense]